MKGSRKVALHCFSVPDLIKDTVIADAKYKRLSDPKDSRRFNDKIRREDLSQMISDLRITSSKSGIFI